MAYTYRTYYRGTSQPWNIDRGDVAEIEQWEDLSASGVNARIARLGEFGAEATRVGATDVAEADVSLLAAVAFQLPVAQALRLDRCIADPGQATSYTISRLEIDRLRANAAKQVRNQLSIPTFPTRSCMET